MRTIVVVALGAAAVGFCAAVSAGDGGGGGEILFLSNGAPGVGSFGINVMNADGSGRRSVTRPQPQATAPVWLPGGKRIAFESIASPGDRELYGGVWLVHPDGSRLTWALRRVSRAAPDPAWSPRGARMAFVRNDSLYLARADGSRPQRIFRAHTALFAPAWSSDGRRLAVSTAIVGDSGHILVLRPGVRRAKVVVRTKEPAWSPAWSPNGRTIAFAAGTHGRSDLYVMSADGTHRRRLTRSGHVLGPSPLGSWSPDGTRIVVGRWTPYGAGGVSVVSVRAGTAHVISKGGYWPQWSPTGRSIAFAASATGTAPGEVDLVRPDGSQRRRLVPFPGRVRFSPDGRRLAIAAGQLSVVNADGTSLRRLTHPANDWSAVGSPDHRKVAFVRIGPGGSHVVFTVNVDGSGLQSMGPGDFVGWAPDSARVTFSHGGDIYEAAAAAGGAETQLTSGPEDDTAPAWSPNGATIAFTRAAQGLPTDVCLVSAQAMTAPACLSSGGGRPVWSPDGATIAFTVGDRSLPGAVRVGVIRPDGSDRLLVGQGYDPAWAPDSRRLTFIDVSETQDGRLAVVNADGTGLKRLSLYLPETPSWSPDGSRIVSAVCPPQIFDCDIWSVAPDDSSSHRLTSNLVDDISPAWWP